MEDSRQYDCDVLVVGSGASGMAAAITAASAGLKVLIIEKEPRFGGSTARSGGWLWIPGTSLAKVQGIHETPDEGRAYLRHEAGDSYNAERVDAFLEHGPRAVDFFTSNTEVQFDMPLVFPDYHAEAPGGKQGGRSMVARPYDGRKLGSHVRDLAPALPELTVFGMMLGSGKEIVHFMRATRSLASAWYVAKRLTRHFLDVAKHGRGMTLTNGNALAGRLAASAFKLGVPLWLNAPAKSLIIEDGAVRGAVVQRDGATVRVRAARAVVLASGGFPYDIERRKQLYAHAPNGTEHYSPSPTGNAGDGLRLAESAGGQVNTALPNAAAWVPVSVVTRKDGSPGYMPHFIDRAKPGVIAVTRNGRRFTNEGSSYHDFVQEMVRACEGQGETCAWLICDHKTLRKYGLGSVAPFPLPIKRYLDTGYLTRGASVAELAQKTGIDAGSLRQTVEAYNREAALGRDPQFGKGSKAYNRYQGDALHGPNPCVAPIVKGPYYAIKVMIGDIGTFAGLKVDGEGRVLSEEGQVVAGLYAVGNDACSIMGGNYPGAGITLGPALTFGYIAGQSIAATGKAAAGTSASGIPASGVPASGIPASGVQASDASASGAFASGASASGKPTSDMPATDASAQAGRMSAAPAGLLEGKLALVTGAGQGNGRALALGLAAAGARVVATDVQAANAMQTASAIIAAGGEAWSHALDVTDPEACAAIAAQVQLEVGPIDVLVNNAGILIREGIDSPRAAENWKRVLDVNLNGSFNMIHAFLGALRATRGVIINVGSIASFAGVGSTLGYSPSKGGVKMMTQAMARDLAPDGIRVNAIAPGVIETPMTQYTRDDPARLANFMQRIPLGRVGQPEDLVGPAVFLASPMALYVTGVSLPVDGGYLAV